MNEAVKILINGKEIAAEKGTRLSCVTGIDHPCGGRGACGKCKVIVNGNEELACRYKITSDIDVETYGTDKKSEDDYEKAVKAEEKAAKQQRNADMQTLRDNIQAYDEAIDQANAKEKEEADAAYENGKTEREEIKKGNGQI